MFSPALLQPVRKLTCLLTASSLFLSIAACGGGGDGAPPSAAPAQVIVSGAVQAPNGQVVFRQPGIGDFFDDLFVSSAYASLSGVSPVPNGTAVQLGRMSSTGTFTILASTTASGGRYSFNLTSLGLTITSDVVVRVVNGPVQMRAFVTGETVNLDPISETAVRMILEQIAIPPGTAMGSFTSQELRDLVGALDLLTTTNQIAGGATIETTVTAIKQSATADAGLMAFLAAAAGIGDTTEGPGDIGNYFSFTQGNVWRFQGTKSENGQPPIPFINTAMITGTKAVGVVTATVFTETNPDGLGKEEEDYLLKDSRGITNHGNNDATDPLTPQLIPFRTLRFPLQQGATFESVNKTGVNFGDLDGDGRNETGDVLAQVTVAAFESVTVPAGTFANNAKIEATITSTATLSSNGTKVTVTETQTDWLAPGVGPVKRQYQTIGPGFSETVTEELVKFTPAFRFTSVSAARDHTCGLTADGTAYCWGDGGSGQLGNGTTIASATPVPVSSGLTFSSVSVGGSSHTCGLTNTGAAYCWGFGDQGQLGNGSTTLPAPSSALPVPVVGGLTFKSISAGGGVSHGHTCGITTSGAAYCWGFGLWGQLGNGSTNSATTTPTLVSGGLTFASISAGVIHTCGVTTSGAAYCWGYNQSGQLGNGTTTNSPTPVPVSGGLTFTAVSPGDFHTCAVRTNGAAACWGGNGSGELGNGTTTNSTMPVTVSGGFTFASIHAGASVFSQGYTCGITTNRATYCWGGNGAGPLGNGTTTDSPTPVPVSGGLTFATVSAGRDYVCGVTTSGWSAYCWGYNLPGQLGNGTNQSSNIPVRVSPPS